MAELITIENEAGVRLRVGERQYNTYYKALGFKQVEGATDGTEVGVQATRNADGETVQQQEVVSFNDADYTKAQLEEEAKKVGLSGYSSMNKGELIEALNAYYANQNQTAQVVSTEQANAGIDSTSADNELNATATSANATDVEQSNAGIDSTSVDRTTNVAPTNTNVNTNVNDNVNDANTVNMNDAGAEGGTTARRG